jgi:HAD superfamily hydrolase (TIGR01549 family)
MSVQSSNPAILFDLDGTLIDTAYEHVIAWAAAVKGAGISIPNWKIHRRIGMSGQSLMRQVLREHHVQARKINLEKIEEKHAAVFGKMIKQIRPLPGAEDLLRLLTRLRVRWAIATTGSGSQTTRLLQALRIPSHTTIVTGDDVAKAKPSPEIFATAAERLKVPIENCVVVGDSIWDMLAAGRRRALGVGILSGGYSQTELEQSGAYRVYADPADMLEHLEDLGIDRSA